MNPQLNDNVNLPQPNWDKVLKWAAATAVVVTAFAFISRARSFILLAEVVDVAIILGLLGIAAYALIARYTSK